MFVPTKATVKLVNGNTWHNQWIGIILCWFTHCSIIYPVVPIYYFPGHSPNTISSVALNLYVGSQKVASEILDHCDFCWPSRLFLEITLPDSKRFKLSSDLNFSDSTFKETGRFMYQLSVPYQKQKISQLIHQIFGHFSIVRIKLMPRKGLTEGLPKKSLTWNNPVLFFSWPRQLKFI